MSNSSLAKQGGIKKWPQTSSTLVRGQEITHWWALEQIQGADMVPPTCCWLNHSSGGSNLQQPVCLLCTYMHLPDCDVSTECKCYFHLAHGWFSKSHACVWLAWPQETFDFILGPPPFGMFCIMVQTSLLFTPKCTRTHNILQYGFSLTLHHDIL